MRFNEKIEYKEAVDKLNDKYSETFESIKDNIVACRLNTPIEEECIFQILDDFLMAQENKVPLEKIVGYDIARYSRNIIEAVQKRPINKIDWVLNISTVVLIILFLMFMDNLEYPSFIYKIDLGIYELLILVALILDLTRRSLTKKFLEHRKIIFSFYCVVWVIFFVNYETIARYLEILIPYKIYIPFSLYLTFIITPIIVLLWRQLYKKSKLDYKMN